MRIFVFFLDFPRDCNLFSTFVGGYKSIAIGEIHRKERKTQKSSLSSKERLTRSRWHRDRSSTPNSCIGTGYMGSAAKGGQAVSHQITYILVKVRLNQVKLRSKSLKIMCFQRYNAYPDIAEKKKSVKF